MINQENIPDDDDGNPVQPDEQYSNQISSVDDANIGNTSNYPTQDDDISSNESIPSEIENDDVPEQDDTEKFPGDDSNIGDNPIYPDKDDIVPKNNNPFSTQK